MRKEMLVLMVVLMTSFLGAIKGQNPAKVIVYRENNFQGSVISYQIMANDSLLVRIKNNAWAEKEFEPGIYDFWVFRFPGSGLRLDVQSGRTYYLRFGLRMGLWSTSPELILVDSLSAAPVLAGGGLRKLEKNAIPLFRPKNRIGVQLMAGGGLENTDLFTTTEGDKSSFSYGGGIGIGLAYGYELDRYLDLSAEAIYQVSTLRPPLKNADVSFRRLFISLTPAGIIPIQDGESMRVKIGGGLDLYSEGLFKIDANDVPDGITDTWTYESTVGFHVSGVFEMNVSETWSFRYGVKYYQAKYKFKEGNLYEPTDKRLSLPDGSGIDVILGFFYHF